jgi:hypothetical protein
MMWCSLRAPADALWCCFQTGRSVSAAKETIETGRKKAGNEIKEAKSRKKTEPKKGSM